MTEVKIRKATEKDIVRIAELLHEYDLYENKLDKKHKIDSIKEIISFNKKLMKSPLCVYFVLEINKELQGVISGEYRITALGKRAIFHQIIVSEKFRGKGYGNKLIDALEKHFKKKGCNALTSHILPGNKKIQEFYKKRGYDIEERINITKKLR